MCRPVFGHAVRLDTNASASADVVAGTYRRKEKKNNKSVTNVEVLRGAGRRVACTTQRMLIKGQRKHTHRHINILAKWGTGDG